MRIGIDIRPLQKTSRYRGIGSYLRNLVGELSSIDYENEYVFYSLKNCEPFNLAGYGARLQDGSNKWREHPLFRLKKPERLHWVWDTLFLPASLKNDAIDIFHANEITSIPSSNKGRKYKVIVTVHDMIPFIFPEASRSAYPFDYRIALRQGLQRLKNVDTIISPSEATKNDVLKFTEFPPGHIKVIYEGVQGDFSPLDKRESRKKLAENYGLSDSYMLYLGGVDFRKNIDTLLHSFSRCIKKHRIEHFLVLAGEAFERTHLREVQTVFESIHKLGLEKRVKVVGYVSEDRLNYLYSGAEVFVLPSLYEGFGLPVLESMSCGTPVVASNASSIPEVAGDAAILLDPYDVEAIADAMYTVLTNSGVRNGMIQRGLERAKRFTWKKMATETVAVYKNLIQQEEK